MTAVSSGSLTCSSNRSPVSRGRTGPPTGL